MSSACGSHRFCVECALQKRAQRIQRWREAGTPEVGIFYVIDGELWIESTPVPEAKHLQEIIIHFRKHRSYWNMLRQMIRTLEGVPHTCYPRGRVVYVQAAARYDLSRDGRDVPASCADEGAAGPTFSDPQHSIERPDGRHTRPDHRDGWGMHLPGRSASRVCAGPNAYAPT